MSASPPPSQPHTPTRASSSAILPYIITTTTTTTNTTSRDPTHASSSSSSSSSSLYSDAAGLHNASCGHKDAVAKDHNVPNLNPHQFSNELICARLEPHIFPSQQHPSRGGAASHSLTSRLYHDTKNRYSKLARICAGGFLLGDATEMSDEHPNVLGQQHTHQVRTSLRPPHNSAFVVAYTLANGKSYIRYLQREEIYDQRYGALTREEEHRRHEENHLEEEVTKNVVPGKDENAVPEQTDNDAMEVDEEGGMTTKQGDEGFNPPSVPTQTNALDQQQQAPSANKPPSPNAIFSPQLFPNASRYFVEKSFNTPANTYVLSMDQNSCAPHSVVFGFSFGDLAVYDQYMQHNPKTGQVSKKFRSRRFNLKKFDSTHVTCVKWYDEHRFFATFASGFAYLFDVRNTREYMPVALSSPSSPSSESSSSSSGSHNLNSSQSNSPASNGKGSTTHGTSGQSSATQNISATKTFERIKSVRDYISGQSTHVWKNEKESNPVVCLDMGQNVRVNDIAFSHDMRFMAAACSDGYLRVFDMTDSKRFKLVVAFRSLFGSMYCCSWTPDDCYLIAGGEDDSLNVYSITERMLLARGEGHESFVRRIHVDPHFEDEECYRIISCGEDCQLLVWELDPPQPRYIDENSCHASVSTTTPKMSIDGSKVNSPKKQQTTGAGNGKTKERSSPDSPIGDTNLRANVLPSNGVDNARDVIVCPSSLNEIPVFDPVQNIRQRNAGPIWDCVFLNRQDVAAINDQGDVSIYRLFEESSVQDFGKEGSKGGVDDSMEVETKDDDLQT